MLCVVLAVMAALVAHTVNQFTLEGAGNSTNVTCSMRGTQPFVLKVMSVFVSSDKLLGKHFEMGLSNLKDVAEGSAGTT